MLIQLLFKTLIDENQQSNQHELLERIQQVERLVKDEHYDQALAQMRQYEKLLPEKDELSFNCKIIQSEILLQMKRGREGFELATQTLHESRQLEKPLHQLDALLSLAGINSELGEYNEGLEMLVQSERLLKTLPPPDQPSVLRERELIITNLRGYIYC